MQVLHCEPLKMEFKQPELLEFEGNFGFQKIAWKRDPMEWFANSPVFEPLMKGLGIDPSKPKLLTLAYQGPTQEWLAIGLDVMVAFEVPHQFNIPRQSWDVRHILAVLNRDGTRVGVASDEIIGGPNDGREIAIESLAWRAGGGIPDVD